MSRAFAVTGAAVYWRIRANQVLSEQIKIHHAKRFGTRTYFLDLSSDAIPPGGSLHQDLIVEGDAIRFSPGDEFVAAVGGEE